MKIVVTGSLGHISEPLAKELVKKGHAVVIVSSTPERQKAIEALGAGAAIGSVDDVEFLTKTYTGADAVYCMNPTNFSAPDQIAYYEHIANCYAKAISQSKIKRVLYLSSYGAHLPSGTGFVTGSHKAEKILDAIPDIQLTHLRPGYFYYNLFGFIPMIKTAGSMGGVYGGDAKLALVAPVDIAAASAEEILDLGSANKVRYIASDDRTCNEVAAVLGKAIGKPDLKWLVVQKEEVLQSLLTKGVPQNAAENLIELGLAVNSGILREDYELNKPKPGKVALEDFAVEFAKMYYKQ
ncbi:NmrA family NAD(P)-binding protein [Longitalea arenae]|uniref:NmrA family NAD(P)-binding protein n=1 Tax=Longitalea arenae TaxID=2812558 RepID=UPI0019676B91|nr:NmrA family NAD(P)-binding protein [Longitalea arenae]